MGVNLSKLIEKEEITIDYLQNKKVGIDSYNMLYQFLASIRGQDGLPLADSHGNITSHIAGLFYRTINLLEKGVKPVYVFDGIPSELKAKTLEKRREVRTDATKKASAALQEGKMEEAKKYGSRALKLTKDMVDEAKEFLTLLGIPIVQAPQEGEAQASVMVAKGQLDGVVSQDFDALLFGATHLYRNIGFSGKRKVAGKNFYVDIKQEHLDLEKVLKQLKINRQKLIWLGILVGTDFNDKFPRVGPKTAIKLVQEFDTFEEIIEKTGHQPDFDYKEIEDVFMNPVSCGVEDSKLEQSNPNKEKLVEFLVEKHDFSSDRVENTLNKFLTQKEEREKQKGLSDWF
ncbi:MAG: flap endonuclease-1 [Candidatus Diapherotrites archaeon]|jgi:flap endonuclease-1|uniref:Flap endonuclease 1 n=1 Tax=Candidatus Iainarchaeum sp. TaxID=3101447 RepID=A0A8T5GFP9_9ARCH|nr:flap endonuclease-1 [Candidatus Diapherotrites archaeon]MBT7241127.1 flap endonuclease-1 [Candidatus Diapherotrites archaeon]